jgi:hypothetical protein
MLSAETYQTGMDLILILLRLLEVANTEPTGEGLLDETLKLLQTEPHSICTWIDLLSGNFNVLILRGNLESIKSRFPIKTGAGEDSKGSGR